ncbi:MAG: GNAT family N-acetyltransferase [Acidobacteriota bacterium]
MSAVKVRIRPMKTDDAAAVARLSGELGYPAAAEEIAARLAGLSGRPAGALLVAEAAGEVIGWIHVSEDATLTDGPIAEIRGLVVDSRMRGRGVGRELVGAAEGWAASRGYPRVRVRSRVAREDAHRFYGSAGYAIAKTQHVFDKNLVKAEHENAR